MFGNEHTSTRTVESPFRKHSCQETKSDSSTPVFASTTSGTTADTSVDSNTFKSKENSCRFRDACTLAPRVPRLGGTATFRRSPLEVAIVARRRLGKTVSHRLALQNRDIEGIVVHIVQRAARVTSDNKKE